MWKVDSNRVRFLFFSSSCRDRSVAQTRTTLSVISGSLGTLRRTQRTFMRPKHFHVHTLEVTFDCVQAVTNSLLFSWVNILRHFLKKTNKIKRHQWPSRSIWRNDSHPTNCPVQLATSTFPFISLLQGMKEMGMLGVVNWTKRDVEQLTNYFHYRLIRQFIFWWIH